MITSRAVWAYVQNYTVQYGVVYHTVYTVTLLPGWWITNWNLLHTPSNQISTLSYCSNVYLCILKLAVHTIVILHLWIGSDTFIISFCTFNVQVESKRWTQLNSKWRLNTSDSWLWYSKFSARTPGWLVWATLKTLLNLSHILLWYTRLAGACAFTQTAYLLKLVIPTTNALPRWRLNVETKTNHTLHSSRRLSFNELKSCGA